MGCNIDHTLEDVQAKLEAQRTFLPEEVVQMSERFLAKGPSQDQLNELFHLLKKYDLADEEEQHERNRQITALTTG
ncbi:hypothetical protein ACSVDE_13770 [Pseudalkalibacillus sp. Hm43]|uniref:hypothetical protein n=1 Tax=Pseudalkalibacillus sp. Hm43 TaxID=3450742 RepID=UPI003F42FCC5